MKTRAHFPPVGGQLWQFFTAASILLLGAGLGQAAIVQLLNPSDGALVTSPTVGFTVSVVDEQGLASAALFVGPVSAPQIITQSGPDSTEDTQLSADTPDTNLGEVTNLNVDGATPHAHGLIKFATLIGPGTGQVPAGARILSATLQLYCSNVGNPVTFYRLIEDWAESAATWNTRLSGVSWTVAGADGAASHAPEGMAGSFTTLGWVSVDVTPLVQDWSDGAPNYGLVMMDGGTDGVDFDSSESVNAPVLAVTYEPPPAALELKEVLAVTGSSATVTFSEFPMADGQQYAWNCLVSDSDGQQTWAAANAHFTVDTHYPAPPELIAPLHGALAISTTAPLTVNVTDPDAGDRLVVTWYGRDGQSGGEFTLAVLPDTQKYVATSTYAGIFTQQTSWIVNNRLAHNIVFVTHEGDVSDSPTDAAQYERANASLSVLDGMLPYGLVPGNHDQPTTLFNLYFPHTRYAGQPWYGGHYPADGHDNSYQLFSAGGVDFVIVHLQFWPGDAEIDWADSVLKAHPNRRAIITTHGFLGLDASRTVHVMGSTQYIWDRLVVPNNNVYFVLCGHVHGEARRTDVVNGREVHQLLADYQSLPEGGEGWLRLMRFVPAENRVYVQTFSPYLNSLQTDAESQFDLHFPMGGFAEIGTQGDVASGTTASLPWSGLSPETDHEWFVSIRDNSGRTTVGPVWQFRTGADTVAPVIAGLTTGDLTSASVRIVWSTDEPSDSLVWYRPAGGTFSEAASPDWVTSHSLLLEGLAPVTTYEFYVTSADAVGNRATSPVASFTTASPPPTEFDAFATENPIITLGTLSGNSYTATTAADGVVQTLTEALAGSGKARLDVEYVLRSEAPPAQVTALTLSVAAGWTRREVSDPLKVYVWNGTMWLDITADLQDGTWAVFSGASAYVAPDGSVRVRFTDAAGIRRELLDTLTVDLLKGQLSTAPVPNAPPIANAGPDSSGHTGETLAFDGSASSDSDGTIVSYAWDFGDGATAAGAAVTHVYSGAGSYTVKLTVTDDEGAAATDQVAVTVTEPPTEVTVFADSFEVSEWNGLWTEDNQNDWYRSTQRATDGSRSAEVDGSATDAALTSIPINLQGRSNVRINFDWLIESGLDSGEYLDFRVSTDGGATWTPQATLRGNVDSENTWHSTTIELNGIPQLQLQFRGKMTDSSEDANLDNVSVVAY